REVAPHQEFNVFGGDILCVEVEESLLCLEVADLKQAVQTLNWSFAPVSQRTLGLGHGEKVGALEVIEIGQAIKRVSFGLRQHGQPFAVGSTRRLVGLQLGLGRVEAGRSFPYKACFRASKLSPCEAHPGLQPRGGPLIKHRFRESWRHEPTTQGSQCRSAK